MFLRDTRGKHEFLEKTDNSKDSYVYSLEKKKLKSKRVPLQRVLPNSRLLCTQVPNELQQDESSSLPLKDKSLVIFKE